MSADIVDLKAIREAAAGDPAGYQRQFDHARDMAANSFRLLLSFIPNPALAEQIGSRFDILLDTVAAGAGLLDARR